jgi:hypothetical protein
MKWRVRKEGARERALHQWHLWFAWYPVDVPTKGKTSGQTRVWLETVCRTGFYFNSREYNSWSWEYKEVEIKKELNNEEVA